MCQLISNQRFKNTCENWRKKNFLIESWNWLHFTASRFRVYRSGIRSRVGVHVREEERFH